MKYPVGHRLNGVINNITDLGIFVSLPGRRSGLVHHRDFGNNWLRSRQHYRVGQEVRVVITHNYKGRIALSLMRVHDPHLIDPENPFEQTKASAFKQVLEQTVRDAQSEIKQLRQTLQAN